jgi:hypothetical protein
MRKRNREYTSFSLSLKLDGPISGRSSRGLPLIMMMQTAYFRQGDHSAGFRELDSAGVRAIHLEGKMGTTPVVIGDIRGEHAPEMLVVEDDDLIEHITTDTSDESLTVGILPGTARGDLHFFDADVLDAVLGSVLDVEMTISNKHPKGISIDE